MDRIIRTRTGYETQTLTNEEILRLAEMGDGEARIEVFKNRIRTATTDSEKLNLVIAFLTRDAHVR